MKRNLILLAVVLSTVYGILYTSSAAAAEVGFSVSESLFDISLPPGAEQEVQLVVFNQSNAEPLPVHLELTLWGLNDDTDSIEFTTADEALNAARWFELAGTPDFILQPTGEHEVVWNISVPPEAPAGSYLVMARFIPALPEHYFSEAGPRSVPELGVLFFIKVVPLGFEMADSYRASITSFQPQGRGWKFIPGAEAAAKAGQAGVYGSLASAFQALVKNEGLYFFKAQGTVEVRGWWGRQVAHFVLPEKYLLPGNTRQLTAQSETESWFKRRLHFGLYHAQLALAVPNHDLPVVSEVSFWVIPWDFILALLAVAGAIIASRRRVWAAARALAIPQAISPIDHSDSYGIINPSLPSPPKARSWPGTASVKKKPKRTPRRLSEKARSRRRLIQD